MTAPQSESLPTWQQYVLSQRRFEYTSPLSVDACRVALADAVEQDTPTMGVFDNHSQQIDFVPEPDGVVQFHLVRRRRSRGVNYATAIVVGRLAPTSDDTSVTGHVQRGGSYTALIGVLVVLAVVIIVVAMSNTDAVTMVLGVGSVIAISLTLRFMFVDRQWVLQTLEEAIQAKAR